MSRLRKFVVMIAVSLSAFLVADTRSVNACWQMRIARTCAPAWTVCAPADCGSAYFEGPQFPDAGGGAGPTAFRGSDLRLKTDVAHIATLENGIEIYSFKFRGNETIHVGVMAQDLLSQPGFRNAVTVMPNGFYGVNYTRLGLKMTTLDQWQKSGISAVLLNRNPEPEALRQGERAWIYGDEGVGTLPPSRKLFVGRLQGIGKGQVELVDNRDKVVRVALVELSSTDQQIVVDKLCQEDRLWTDHSQRFHRNAKFVRVEGKSVILKGENGRKISVPLEWLCAADQCVVKHLWKKPIPGLPTAGNEYVARK